LYTSKPLNILLVDDDPDAHLLVGDIFATSERRHILRHARDGKEALDYLLRRGNYRKSGQAPRPDLILLDRRMPNMDGDQLCGRLRADVSLKNIPIIMLSGEGKVTDVVKGLGIGADDYLKKPYHPDELIARVEAILARLQRDDNHDQRTIQMPGLTIDPNYQRVEIEGTPADFTSVEFRLLHLLASRPGRVFTRAQLLDALRGQHSAVGERTVDVHIRALRRKLGPHQDLIQTVRGSGYRFAEPLTS
jgi:DNA-binding response OmpR family regulator